MITNECKDDDDSVNVSLLKYIYIYKIKEQKT